MRTYLTALLVLTTAMSISLDAAAQIGRRFASERQVVKDPVTGAMLTFLTTRPHGDSKIYPTHPQWTADGEWIVFRSQLAGKEALAVNESSGASVQVTGHRATAADHPHPSFSADGNRISIRTAMLS